VQSTKSGFAVRAAAGHVTQRGVSENDARRNRAIVGEALAQLPQGLEQAAIDAFP
jgi:hypothetical protein